MTHNEQLTAEGTHQLVAKRIKDAVDALNKETRLAVAMGLVVQLINTPPLLKVKISKEL